MMRRWNAPIAAGAQISTHLGNGSDAVLPRLANYIWRQLGEDRLWASFIADGHHLPPATLRCMLRAKGPARSILVTDAIELTGMPPGRYMRRGVEAELTKDGKVVLVGSPYLAGSVATMPLLIAHAVSDAGLTFAEAVRLATLQPESLMRRHVTCLVVPAGAARQSRRGSLESRRWKRRRPHRRHRCGVNTPVAVLLLFLISTIPDAEPGDCRADP